MLELLVVYSNDKVSWHPIELIKNENPQATTTYILSNDLGRTSNEIYERWVQLFILVLKQRTLRYMRRTSLFGFQSATYVLSSKKKLRSWRYNPLLTAKVKLVKLPPASNERRIFKFGLEVPRKFSDILCIDDVVGNRVW